jgi:predicted secreted protein
LAQLSQKFKVNAVTISKWKSEFLANLSATFSNVKETENSEPEVPVEKLYTQIGKLKVELDFLKKKCKEIGDTRERMEAVKRKKQVSCTVHTRINAALKKDLEKHNQQYPVITLVENRSSQDRFIILNNCQLYHIGASLKDLGNKCFAFSRMDKVLPELTSKLLNAYSCLGWI